MLYNNQYNTIKENQMEKIMSLIDLKFDRILTIKVIRLLYVVIVAFAAFGAVATVIVGIANNDFRVIILGPLGALLYLIFFRLIFESLIVKFQMARDIRDIRSKYVSSLPPPPTL